MSDAIAVSLVLTVLNEGPALHKLFRSIHRQTRQPDEIVVVDGGSTDDTVAILDSYTDELPLTILVEPAANISCGRNAAIDAARHDVIAVTDAGVRLDPKWLERLMEHFERDTPAAFVSGFFRPDPQGVFEVALAATTLPAPEEMGQGRFMPSSRSVAFRRDVWQSVGGYPEWADYSEDVLFDLAIMAAGVEIEYEPEAVVYFRPRPNFPAFARQYRNYAYGDGQGLLWPKRHAIRYGTYGIGVPLLLALLRRRPLAALAGFGGGGAVMFFTPYKRLWRMRNRLGSAELLCALLLVPLIRVTGDLAKMWGYPQGLPEGRRNARTVQTYRTGDGEVAVLKH